jgi:hypothetical protein
MIEYKYRVTCDCCGKELNNQDGFVQLNFTLQTQDHQFCDKKCLDKWYMAHRVQITDAEAEQ